VREAALEIAPQHPVPLFPLPDFVLFPRAVAPIHVYELRGRTLVRDALRADRLVTFALLQSGWERGDEGCGAFHPVGCLARVDHATWRPDDCYDLRITGLSRVRIGRVVREYPYRAARVTLVPQEPLSDDDPLVQLEWQALHEAYARIRSFASPELRRVASRVIRVTADGVSFEGFVNEICSEMTIAAAEKHALLELDSVLERARRIRERIERDLRSPRPRGGADQN
jgi:Lon protease-like protein